MVAAWGGCDFITETSPLRAFVSILNAYFRLAWISRLLQLVRASGTLASMPVPFVGFQPVRTSAHRAAMGVWVAATGRLHRAGSLARSVEGVPILVADCFGRAGIVESVRIVALALKGRITPWTGRFCSFWDTGHAKKWVCLVPYLNTL